MSTSKRRASVLGNDADAPPSKTPRTADAAGLDLTDLFEIEIKVPSVAKAARNDYQPPSSAQLKMNSIFNGGDASPLTEEERQEIFGNPREAIEDNLGQAAASQTEHAEESKRYVPSSYACKKLQRICHLTWFCYLQDLAEAMTSHLINSPVTPQAK
jgi:hypothetical protein